MDQKKKIIISVAGVLLLVFVFIGVGLYQSNTAKKSIKLEKVKTEEIKTKAEKFINESLLPANMKVNIKNVVEEGDLYALTLAIDGKDYTSYMSKDGKKFFQSGMDIEQVTKEAQDAKAKTDQSKKQPEEKISKTDKPNVELFVMSYCPYGTQIEKGILPVVEALGNKIDFTLKFCDYAMHEQKELNEQMVEYCIQKDNKDKFNSYLACFLNNSDSVACLKLVGLDKAKIDSCVESTDQQYSVTKKFNDKSTWANGNFPPFDVYKDDNAKYGVQGSPTLVINGSQSQAGRDSASLLTVICSAFNNPPAECSKKMSSTPPSPGFGEGTNGGATSGAGCAK